MRKLLLIFLFAVIGLGAQAQTDTIRYVKKDGKYANDGRSWATAKDNIQDAINDLRTYMARYGLHGGSVYVAAGTYEPTEGVEGGTSGQLSTSFIIYEGIHVYGGFNPSQPESKPGQRVLIRNDHSMESTLDDLVPGDTTVVRWMMKTPSILSGNHNHSVPGTFTWNAKRNRYETRFPGNSYHVVFFASNGFIDDADHPGYADTLKYRARLDGFTVRDGNASGASDVRRGGRDHTSMGGGIYMVKNAVVENCIVERCSAAMRGGGVYMDGGGELVHSLVRMCQTLGSGVSGGYGGGVCIDNNGEVHRSWITRNVARMGGGAAIISYPEQHPRGGESAYRSGGFDPYISATVVSNNTSTTEAGGIYLDRGGVVNHVTVVRNENDGRDISYGRTRYGRSGGIYIYGAGQVYNSVIWGNRCAANNDIQYAATAGVSIPSYITLRQPFVGYTALNNMDITNFTGTVRLSTYSFESDNDDRNRSGNFTLFMNPPAQAGAGIGQQTLRAWYPYSKTSLENKAVQLSIDYSTQAFSVMSYAREDLFDKPYEPISTLGAVETGIEEIQTAQVAPVNTTDCTADAIPTLFVDPDRVFNDPSHSSGSSWDDPLDNISEAIEYFRQHPVSNGKFQILVKQGTMKCSGIGAYYDPVNRGRSVLYLSSIRMIPNLMLYGGFPASLTGTSTQGRNPKDYPSRITADIISAAYDNNALHVVSFATASDAVLDGFQLYYGNARSTHSESEGHGGGIVVSNQFLQPADRTSMTGNVVRNCVIANCSGTRGAAVFAGGGYAGVNGTVKAELTMENCVISNDSSATSIVHAAGDATITMSHCTVVGNVTGSNGALLVATTENGATGAITVNNTAFHGNAKTPLSLVNNIAVADIPTLWLGAISGKGNLIDNLYTRTYDGFDKAFGYESADTLSYPSFTNPIRNVGVARNTADNTVYGGAADFTPLDTNPMVNRATTDNADHTTWGTDLTATVTRDYGGAPDVGALECHQDSDNTSGGQPTYGTVIYVRDYNTYDAKGNVATADNGTTDRDGTSWARAINGNAAYTSAGTTVNGLQYAVDQAAATAGDKPEVWVAKGFYTNKSTGTINDQNYAFAMREGVNVYGGFPSEGNPSMRERNPKAFVTVLQPQNVDPTDLNSDLIRQSAASVARVLVQPGDFTRETSWNGFTIRYGYLQSAYRYNIQGNISRIKTERIGNAGGAGAYLMEKGVLENCELTHNVILVDPTQEGRNLKLILQTNDGGFHQAGAGAYITTGQANGEGGTLKNCVVAYNELLHKYSRQGNPESAWMYGAGVYQNKGIIYNTIIHDNTMRVIAGTATAGSNANQTNEVLVGAGAFLVNGQFYNNTITHNTAYSYGTNNHNRLILIPGVYVYTDITMYNSIVSDNTSAHTSNGHNNTLVYDVPVCAFMLSGSNIYQLDASKVKVHYSYISIEQDNSDGKNLCKANDGNNTNIYLDHNKGTVHTPDYTSAQIYDANTFRLVSGSPCINEGTDAIEGVNIPSIDAAYAERIQDCTIDIGAYEYNGAENITPRERKETHYYFDAEGVRREEQRDVADYFVTQNGRGDASARDPYNAACADKLQRVLDAAGRYKYAHPQTHVIVRLEAQADSAGYMPTRTAATSLSEEDNPRSYSIIVPRGVELQGGWPLNGDFGIDSQGNLHGRDPINNVTRLTGLYHSGTEDVNVYHVVTFTDHLYDEDGHLTDHLLSETVQTYVPDFDTPALNQDFGHAKLDGLYIEGGRATGMSDADRRGAAAVLTGYAQVSDCIVRDNQASGYGGAFYMLPGSILEGTILENNRAAYGGAVAVAETAQGDVAHNASWAFILNSTITANTATSRGGGLWFNDNARTMNSVYWLNTSAEQNEIAGITSTTNDQNLLNCPVNFCAVTNETLAGYGNINLSPNNADGTRWGKDTNLKQKHRYDFFLPSRASVLSRAGLPYDVMHTLMGHLPGIDSVDIAGVSRLGYTDDDVKQCATAYDGEALAVKYNYNLEIGARALNQNFTIAIDPKHPLYRLFVAHPENMQADLANAMMESGDATYDQQGSSFANPFLRLTDALDYVVDARKNYPDIARNHRFEIFLAEGTYMPHADLLGQQQNVRTRTFVVPEMVTIMGGIDAKQADNRYCQSTGADVKIASGDSTITLKGASSDDIRLKRERYDLNQNSVVEPWEMQHATVLSGFSEGSDLTVKNVYHVITSIADKTVVGQEPDMYSDDRLSKPTTDRHKESALSRGRRAIIMDGLTITEGSATGYEGTSVRNHNFYFRGGGIFVCGFPLYENNSNESTANDIAPTGISDMRQGQRNIPVIVSNMLFQNNQARQGGAIYTDGSMHVVGSSFVQNLAVSPSPTETADLQYVTFSGGGAIATNDTILATNTIFANNEARDGGGQIAIVGKAASALNDELAVDPTGGKRANVTNEGFDANSIRAYGGVIWAGDSAAVRLINCNSVRNKAKAFASIYNCMPNTENDGVGHPHFGINCVFWGNEVAAGQDSSLINYGTHKNVGALFFSAYQKGHGIDPTVTTDNKNYQGTLLREYRYINDLDSILGHANHNVIINGDNDAVDGPNFTLPSNEAGVDGYMPSADWVPSRVNALTDAGWGLIHQTTDGKFQKEKNPDFPNDTNDSYLVYGAYGWLSDFYRREYNLTLLPLADEKYMAYADEVGNESATNMDRISSDPLGTVTDDYIDIGVYEYQHKLLHIADGDEVDTLWVSDAETTGDNDGRSFEHPTSDLQRAIQTLLLSRNNHPKVILMMQGTYAPIYEQDNGDIGFVVRTQPNNTSVSLPDTIATGRDYQATSLTIQGGYSKEIEGLRDVSRYPTVLRMNRRDMATDANTAHLFYIVDAEQWGTSGALTGQGDGDGSYVKMTDQVTKTSVSRGQALPVVLDGLTFVNTYANARHLDLMPDGSSVDVGTAGAVATAGAAIYYREQFKSQTTTVTGQATGSTEKSANHLLATAGAPKLTIRNCKFNDNGQSAAVPAVYIGEGGGRTLVYNSLFNNNMGNPIVSMDPVDIVNCTFANNGGHITVKGDGADVSTLSNSLIWRDDSASAYAHQYEGFAADSVRFNAIYREANRNESAGNHNVNLSETNADPMGGPNFVKATATPGVTLDYRINPGMRTMDRADTTLYKRLTAGIRQGVSETVDEVTRVILKPDTTWRYDLSWGDRIYGNGLDRGAYECRVQQQRVLYVIPTKTTGTMTGTSWENAYGQGQLQTAVDAAAIYAFSHTSAGNKKTRSYVLVKGEANNTSAENTLSLRDGVSVYGSIPDSYLASISEKRAEDNSQLSAYLDSVLSARPGIAARSARRSRVQGLRTLDDSYDNGSLVDGFEVRATAAQTGPVVNITKPVVLSKLIIHDNTVTGTGQPAVNMQQGLMYNSLVYANTPAGGQPTMQLGRDAAVINSTIVSNKAGVTAIDGEGLLANSVTFGFAASGLSGDVSRGSTLDTLCVNNVSGIPFAPYLTAGVNPYRLPAYITGYAPYQYQLNESAHDIDGGEDSLDKILSAAQADRLGGTASAAWKVISCAADSGWIDFRKDCDLLGNNRLLGLQIDRGCFETWYISKALDITANRSQYPHEGSVVYLMDDANLSLGESTREQVFTSDDPFRPAFLLLRPGASLYGNGDVIQLSYVAAETVVPQGGKHALISLPFKCKIGEMLRTTVKANNQIDATPLRLESAQTYNGARRAAWNYHFDADNSSCWEAIADTTQWLPAGMGWLATLPDSVTANTSVTLRLVSYGDDDADYVYTEDGTPKTITLTQHDDRPGDGTAHFTKAENMGWNIMGLPYLVNNYRLGSLSDDTQTTTSDDLTDYPMALPHVIYRLGADGRFTTVQSWASDARLSMGEGVMTQTAVNGTTETVTFAIPVKENTTAESSAKPMIALRSEQGATTDVLQMDVSTTAHSLQYTLGSDGVKWMPLDDGRASLYALSATGTPMSLASATPLETDIAVKVDGAVADSMVIALADTAAFSQVSHVWLRDNADGTVVDLKEEPMPVKAVMAQATLPAESQTRQQPSRSFTLRLGDTRPDGSRLPEHSAVHIYVNGRTLHVNGLRPNDTVGIYTISGQLYLRDRAEGDAYTHELQPGVYIVRAGGRGQAVAVK